MEPILHREAGHRGTTRGRLRNGEYAHPVDGVAIRVNDSDDLAVRCRAIQLVLPEDAVFTHLTSARLRGWWLPRIDDEPVIACTDGAAPHHDRRGVYVRRCNLPDAHRTMVRGVAVASPEWTIVELAEHLSLIDLVVVIDCVLHRREATITSIQATLRRGRRGVRVLRRAIALADGRSESPWETVLRLLHVLSAIPVDPQHELRDHDGEPIWSLDLLIRGTRRAHEFDGGVHRSAEAHLRDMRRDRLLARHDIERFAYGAKDVIDAPGQIIGEAEDALGLPRDPTRLRLWLPEIARSTFEPRGYVALLCRIERFTRQTSPRSSRQSPPSGAK